jgi:Ca2+-transporting ATPase
VIPHAAEVGEVARGLSTHPERGLGVTEAAARLTEHGPNELQAGDPVRPGTILLGQLTSPMILCSRRRAFCRRRWVTSPS